MTDLFLDSRYSNYLPTAAVKAIHKNEQFDKVFEMAKMIGAKRTSPIEADHWTWRYNSDCGKCVAIFYQYETDLPSLARFYTLKEYRGKGIGSEVLSYFTECLDALQINCRLWAMPFDFRNVDEEQHYLDNDLMDLENWHMTKRKSKRLIGFYERHGFQLDRKDRELMLRWKY